MSTTIIRDSKISGLCIGYRCTFTGMVTDADIASGQTGVVCVDGAELLDGQVTVSNGHAAVSGTFCVPEDSGVTDDSDFSRTVTVTVGGKAYSKSVTFRKQSQYHQKAGAFEVFPDGVSYVDEDGQMRARQEGEFTWLTGEETSLSSGWYAVPAGRAVTLRGEEVNTDRYDPVVVSGDIHLILCDDATLTADARMLVPEGNSLSIYAQGGGTGTLIANTEKAASGIGAGIGGENSFNSDALSAGTIRIYGGVIRATGDSAPAIGGGYQGEGGSVTIAGGRLSLNAPASFNALGGYYCKSFGTIMKGAVTLTWRGTDMELYTSYMGADSQTTVTFERPFALNGRTLVPVVTYDPAHFEKTGDNEYTIHTSTGWDAFCDLLAYSTKGIFTGKTVYLDKDITVTRMAGSSQHDFTGTFDGGGKTLTFNYGSVAIRNCRSSVTILSSVNGDGTHGGLVAVNNNSEGSDLTIDGCVFDGKLLTTNGTIKCGGFIGWRGGAAVISNSLFAPAEATGSETWVGNSGITPYANGITRTVGDATTFYYGGGDIVSAPYVDENGDNASHAATALSPDHMPATLDANYDSDNDGTPDQGWYYVADDITYTQTVTLGDDTTLILADAAVNTTAVNTTAIATAATACTGSKTLAVQLQGRTLYKDGNWNTLCLPFDVALAGSPLEGATVKELLTTSNLNNGTLTLNFSDNLTAIEAGKPYIVNWAKADGYDEADPEIRDVKNPVFTGVTVSSTSNNEGSSWDGDGVESDDY